MSLLDELQSRVVAADGAMGTELLAAGAPAGGCLEELCVSDEGRVRAVHAAYLAAGARILRTNTFGANAVRLARHGHEHRVGEINWTAAQLARDCAGKDVIVGGSVGPLGITEAEALARGIDREAVFLEQIGALIDGGARLIFLETFTALDELLIAVHVKHSLHHLPVIASIACNSEGRLQDGTMLRDAFTRLRAADADILGVNCVGDPAATLRALEGIDDPGPLAAFPSAGLPVGHRYALTPAAFATGAQALAARGVRLLGGCCGVGPAHIAAHIAALTEAFTPAHD